MFYVPNPANKGWSILMSHEKINENVAIEDDPFEGTSNQSNDTVDEALYMRNDHNEGI